MKEPLLFFKKILVHFLHDDKNSLINDHKFIEQRSEAAATNYEENLKLKINRTTALEISLKVLLDGITSNEYLIIYDLICSDFKNIKIEDRISVCNKLIKVCDKVFEKYSSPNQITLSQDSFYALTKELRREIRKYCKESDIGQ